MDCAKNNIKGITFEDQEHKNQLSEFVTLFLIKFTSLLIFNTRVNLKKQINQKTIQFSE